MVAEERTIRIRGGVAELWDSYEPAVLVEGPAGTGKSFGILTRIYQLCDEYPGIRVLIVRDTRASMSESVLKTWEVNVLPEFDPIKDGPDRANRRKYKFPNGSEVVTGGVDSGERLFSTDYDIVYICEGTEVDYESFQKLKRPLRNNKLPWQQILIDCNPSHPRHWLNQQCLAGHIKRIVTRHADNPTMTKAYLENLSSLTGVLRNRLFLGQWCAAEGIVFEGWDESVHIVKEPPTPAKWYAVGVDWGYTAPGTMQVWGVDGDGRRHLYAEYYHTKKKIGDWVAWAKEVYHEYHPQAFVCDPAEPGYIEEFRGAGLPAIPADNDRHKGFDAVRRALVVQPDGRPRLTVGQHTLKHAKDPALDSLRRPCSLIEEVPGYVYQDTSTAKRNEEPDPRCADHACDACRYANIFIDQTTGGSTVGVSYISAGRGDLLEDDDGWVIHE